MDNKVSYSEKNKLQIFVVQDKSQGWHLNSGGLTPELMCSTAFPIPLTGFALPLIALAGTESVFPLSHTLYLKCLWNRHFCPFPLLSRSPSHHHLSSGISQPPSSLSSAFVFSCLPYLSCHVARRLLSTRLGSYHSIA